MATDVGKFQKRKNIIWYINWKRDASRGNSQGSTIVSCKILFFVNPCSNMIEMKTFVSHGTILQNEISPIEWKNQNIFDTNTLGGSLSTSLETKGYWENVLTKTKRCLHWTVYTENLEDDNSGRCLLEVSETAAVIEFLVVFLRIQRKSVKEDACKGYDGTGEPVVFDLCVKLQTNGFHEFIYNVLNFVADRSCTADGGLL